MNQIFSRPNFTNLLELLGSVLTGLAVSALASWTLVLNRSLLALVFLGGCFLFYVVLSLKSHAQTTHRMTLFDAPDCLNNPDFYFGVNYPESREVIHNWVKSLVDSSNVVMTRVDVYEDDKNAARALYVISVKPIPEFCDISGSFAEITEMKSDMRREVFPNQQKNGLYFSAIIWD